MSPGRKIWQISWRLVVCGLLLVWIFHSIFTNEVRLLAQEQGKDWNSLSRSEQYQSAWTQGPQQLWQTIRLVEPGALVISLVFMGLTILLGVIRWRMVLKAQGLELPFSRAAEISLVAHFFNSFLLGSTGGDLLKAYYAARETHHKKTEAVTTVFADRLIGLFAMLLFAGVFMLFNLPLLAAHPRLQALAWLILAMLGACGLLILLAFRGGVSRGLPQARGWLRRLPKGAVLEQSLAACRELGRSSFFLPKTLLISMALNAVCVFQLMTLAAGLNLDIAPKAMFLIVPMIICISALPITPNGLGVRENLFVLMLAVPEIAVPETKALSLSLLAYGGSLFWSLIGGVVYLTLRDRRHLKEVADVKSP